MLGPRITPIPTPTPVPLIPTIRMKRAQPAFWRNAWAIPKMSEKTLVAMVENDTETRAEMYRELQREHQQTSPFGVMFQQIEQNGMQSSVENWRRDHGEKKSTLPPAWVRFGSTVAANGISESILIWI